MADRPIPFKASEVRALLDGRKRQTRPLLKPQPPQDARYTGIHFASGQPDAWFFNSKHGPCKIRTTYDVGDRLWVRENLDVHGGGISYAAIAEDGNPDYLCELPDGTEQQIEFWSRRAGPDPDLRSRTVPSIHMPRLASRLTLTVTDVRVQRLQEISEEDARAEGVQQEEDRYWRDYTMPGTQLTLSARQSFDTLWRSLHGPGAWDANPWVVAITFGVARRNIDAQPTSAAGEVERG